MSSFYIGIGYNHLFFHFNTRVFDMCVTRDCSQFRLIDLKQIIVDEKHGQLTAEFPTNQTLLQTRLPGYCEAAELGKLQSVMGEK